MYGNNKAPIFHNGCSYYSVISGQKGQTIDLFYKLLKSCTSIVNSFNLSAIRKTYMVIIKSSFPMMVVHTLRKSWDKRNKPLISCIDFLNLVYSYYKPPTRVQIDKYIW